jgi:hypothetical protein
MPCPSSGLILLGKIRQELESTGTGNDYNDGPYTTNKTKLKDACHGVYDTINTNNAVADRPNEVNPAYMTEFYSYDHNASSGKMG